MNDFRVRGVKHPTKDAMLEELRRVCDRNGADHLKAFRYAEMIATGRVTFDEAISIVLRLVDPSPSLTLEAAIDGLATRSGELEQEAAKLETKIHRIKARRREIQIERIKTERGHEALKRVERQTTGRKRLSKGGAVGSESSVEFDGMQFAAGDTCPYCLAKELSDHAPGRLAHLRKCKAKREAA